MQASCCFAMTHMRWAQVERFMTMHESFDLSKPPDGGPDGGQVLSHMLHHFKVRCSDSSGSIAASASVSSLHSKRGSWPQHYRGPYICARSIMKQHACLMGLVVLAHSQLAELLWHAGAAVEHRDISGNAANAAGREASRPAKGTDNLKPGLSTPFCRITTLKT